jgi:hypothetical protein
MANKTEKEKIMAWEFNRHVDGSFIEGLKRQPLWQAKLKDDCEKGNVFLAIRNDYISFYHKGGGLFTFQNNCFSTHVKYALVIDTDDENAPGNYIIEDRLKPDQNEPNKPIIPLIPDFTAGYDKIKKNCELYSGLEAKGVSSLYQTSSYLKTKSIFVLDIEIAFKKDDGKKQDRIDVLLYNNDSQTLRFVEAKHFSNHDLWSNATPKVVEQIKKYEEQIDRHGKKLIEEYGLYIDGLNQIFGKKYKLPKTIDPKVSLLIFGFDESQKQGDRFKKLISNNPEYKKIPVYCKGNPDKDLKAENIWKAK